ncbi:MAG: hypothetical protein CUN56_04895 [Phototrophicales bacterium]|nr:MAG: hypothetical protein CUN56_04895 [Phototrophicales bacterium]RMG71715.1 MAG: hypothetical protein D6711_14645 [Chloroflexota bacterium]
MPDSPYLPEDEDSAQETRAARPTRHIPPVPIPPTPPRTRHQRQAQLPPRPQGKARARRDSGLYLPLWSLALMLFVVIGIAMGVVLLVISLGVQNTRNPNALPTQPAPVVIVSSPVPTERPAAFPASPATPTLPAQFRNLLQAPADFSLAGPVLPTVFISPTPIYIEIGVRVRVVGLSGDELNIRDSAGIFGTTVLFRVPEGTIFDVVAGPLQVDNLSWWQLRDPNDPTRIGWAASQYLEAIP